MLASYFLL